VLLIPSLFYLLFIEVLTPADEAHHIDKHKFKVPFVCGARNLGEALRRISEGAAMIRTKGQAGTGKLHAMIVLSLVCLILLVTYFTKKVLQYLV
jgi:pyridoxal 5'-phosphate synthase pdxS subunit